jgi:hypothetical protein
MTEIQCIEAIERMAKNTMAEPRPFAGADGAYVAHAISEATLLIIGAYRMDAKSIGKIMAIQEVMKSQTVDSKK